MSGKRNGVVLGLLLWVVAGLGLFLGLAQATVSQGGQVYMEGLDAESRKWVRVFYEGNLITKGWKEITADIMDKTPAGQRADQDAALRELGRKISLEWSKPNSVRRINTSMLVTWGNLLEKTAKNNPDRLPMVVSSINREVDSLLD
ncbi:MAG: hypothetical protein ACOX5Z_11645 [Desulfobulbus sp.]|jgi:hypothetical protein